MKATSLVMSVLLLGLTGTAVYAEPASSVSSAADQAARQVAEAFKPLWGTVLSSLPNDRYLVDVTAENGAYVGMELEIFREGEPFKHPVTGQVLGRMDRPVGVVRLVEVQDQFSVAEMVELEDGQQCRQGDGVRVSKARILAGLAHVTSSVMDERQARTLTREIEAALLKTGRFEVMDERMMRSTLTKKQVADTTALTDPRVLGILRETLRLHAVIFPVVRSAEGGLNVELKVVSTFSGRPLYLASAEVRMAAAAPPAASAPTAPQKPQAELQAAALPPTAASSANGQGGPLPAWLGPPTPDASPLNPHFTQNPNFGLRGRVGPGGQPTFYIQPVPPGLKRIAFGDLDGDGQDEMVGITDKKVMVFRWTGRSMAMQKTWMGSKLDNFLLVDVADVNQNGRAEIFATSVDSREMSSSMWSTRLRSVVLELDGEDLVPIWKDVPLYFRVLKYPKFPEGVLLTQPIGRHTPFGDPLRRFVWNGKGYVPDPEWVFPTGLRLDSFALVDLAGDAQEEFVLLGNDGILRVGTQGGKKLAQTNEALGYYDHIPFQQEIHPLDVVVDHDSPRMDDRLIERFIQRRVLVTNLGPEGSPGILVGANYGATISNIVQAINITDSSRVVHYAWDGKGLTKEWASELSRSNYVADYGLTRIWGTPALAILSMDRGLFKKTEGSLEIYRLVPPQSKAATARPVVVPGSERFGDRPPPVAGDK